MSSRGYKLKDIEGEFEIIEDVLNHMETSEMLPFYRPVKLYVEEKIRNGAWDGFNEFDRERRRSEKMNKKTDTLTAFVYRRNGKICGIAFFVVGEYVKKKLEKYSLPRKTNLEDAWKFGPFYITEDARGIGQRWFREIILPYARENNAPRILINSAHARAFSFYERFGEEIGTYTSVSDDKKHHREGRIYLVTV